jgi:arginase family enzyme
MWSEAWKIASRGADDDTFEIDTVAPAYAARDGAACSGGLTPWQVMDALFDRGCRYLVVGFVGVDPTCDPQERLASTLLLTFLAGFRDGG